MRNFYSITEDDIKKIISFVEDGDEAVLETDIVTTFIALNAAFTKRLVTCISGKNRKTNILERKLKRINRRAEAAIEAGDFRETQRDGVNVAYMLTYHLQQMNASVISKNKVIYILYLMYASWLYSKKERFLIEHPCATEWGPQFWRVYGRLDVRYRITQEDYSALAMADPAAAAFCKSAAKKYYDYKDHDLKEMLLKSKPYKNSLPDTNRGKWNKEINDLDIYNWKLDNDPIASRNEQN